MTLDAVRFVGEVHLSAIVGGENLAISKAMTNMAEVQARFAIDYATDPAFFLEWQQDLPSLTDADARRSVVDHQAQLAYIQQRFIEHRDRGSLPEGTVDKLMISSLLDLAGLYDSRFTIRTKASVEIDPEKQGCCGFEPKRETNYGGGNIATIGITNHGPRDTDKGVKLMTILFAVPPVPPRN